MPAVEIPEYCRLDVEVEVAVVDLVVVVVDLVEVDVLALSRMCSIL